MAERGRVPSVSGGASPLGATFITPLGSLLLLYAFFSLLFIAVTEQALNPSLTMKAVIYLAMLSPGFVLWRSSLAESATVRFLSSPPLLAVILVVVAVGIGSLFIAQNLVVSALATLALNQVYISKSFYFSAGVSETIGFEYVFLNTLLVMFTAKPGLLKILLEQLANVLCALGAMVFHIVVYADYGRYVTLFGAYPVYVNYALAAVLVSFLILNTAFLYGTGLNPKRRYIDIPEIIHASWDVVWG